MIKSLILFLFLFVCYVSAITNKITVYDQVNYYGNQQTFYGYEDDLSSTRFDNKICSARLTGIWLFYEHTKYNSHKMGMSFFIYGDSYREPDFKDFKNRASSLRNSGVGSSYKDKSINFYEREGFAGEEEYFSNDTPYFRKDNFGDSIIVTGCSPWTLYEEKYFAGDHICVYPSDENNCLPGFFPNLENLPQFDGKVSSVRVGCFSDRKISSPFLPANATGSYNPKTKEFKFL
uniref:Beta-crystallin A1 n=1 Tax=Lepeophtheirus salmonis TaxID=72036 RepID=D3PHS5_LEPSM|nr:Beta-crystallin A1 [Lepeophtheirus salmonis]